MEQLQRKSPWWLEEGTETCPACSHTYVYQMEYRCVECDGPLCAECVRSISLEIFCPGCTEAPADVVR